MILGKFGHLWWILFKSQPTTQREWHEWFGHFGLVHFNRWGHFSCPVEHWKTCANLFVIQLYNLSISLAIDMRLWSIQPDFHRPPRWVAFSRLPSRLSPAESGMWRNTSKSCTRRRGKSGSFRSQALSETGYPGQSSMGFCWFSNAWELADQLWWVLEFGHA